MKRLLIGLLLVALLVSGCRQAVVTIPPLSAPIPTTTALTWDSVASLPVGTVVELTGYCVSPLQTFGRGTITTSGYNISDNADWSYNHSGNLYKVITKNLLPVGTLVTIKVRVERDGLYLIN